MDFITAGLDLYVKELRHGFHQNPELSMEEYETTAKIREELKKMGFAGKRLGETGVMAELKGGDGGTVLLRADIDALPIEEKSGCGCASRKPGVMHACGHDAHTAMLLGAAKILCGIKEFPGTVRFVFQPAEETGGATRALLAEGLADNVDTAFAIHIAPDMPTGAVSVEEGARMAGVDDFVLRIHGSGGHGAMPHLGTDALLAGAHLVVNLQEIVSREMDPLDPVVVTVGKMVAGVKANILASDAILSGNLRFFRSELRERFPKILQRLATHTADMFRTQASVEYIPSLPPVINDSRCVKIAQDAAAEIFGASGLRHKPMATISEDFSRYLERVPGVLAFLGTCDGTGETAYPLHHECFNLDEKALVMGSALHVRYALNFLEVYSAKKQTAAPRG